MTPRRRVVLPCSSSVVTTVVLIAVTEGRACDICAHQSRGAQRLASGTWAVSVP